MTARRELLVTIHAMPALATTPLRWSSAASACGQPWRRSTAPRLRRRASEETDRKPVQHLEGGIVQEILVKEAQHVEEGQVLFRLQPTQALANADLQRKQLDASLAIEARLVAEQDGAARITFPEAIVQRQALPETANAMADQRRQFAERARSLRNQIAILNARIEQSTKEIEGRDSRRRRWRRNFPAMQRSSNASPRWPPEALTRRTGCCLWSESGRALPESSARPRARSRGSGKRSRRPGTRSVRRSSTSSRKSRSSWRGPRAHFGRAREADHRTRRAHADGGAGSAARHRPGAESPRRRAAVRPGDMLVEVVPEGDVLILAARVSPLDIQSVSGGLRAEVRFPAFSSLHPPTIFGQIESISAASVVDETTKEPHHLARVIIDLGTIAPQLSQTPWCPACPPTCSSRRASARCCNTCSDRCATRSPGPCGRDDGLPASSAASPPGGSFFFFFFFF